MKSIPLIIWILGAFLIVAALDTRPDPPAVNPAGAAARLLQPHVHSCLLAVERYESVLAFGPSCSNSTAADLFEHWHPTDPVAIGQASDSSPPMFFPLS
jgi:hypothetical protein